MSSTPLREALAAAKELVAQCHHTSFAKVDPADTHGACAQCIAQHTQRAVEAERERLYDCSKCGLIIKPVALIRRIIPCPDCKGDAIIRARAE